MSNWNLQIREFMKREHKQLAGRRGWVWVWWGGGGGRGSGRGDENQGLQKSSDTDGARCGFLHWQQLCRALKIMIGNDTSHDSFHKG